jgi:hypothetical protein
MRNFGMLLLLLLSCCEEDWDAAAAVLVRLSLSSAGDGADDGDGDGDGDESWPLEALSRLGASTLMGEKGDEGSPPPPVVGVDGSTNRLFLLFRLLVGVAVDDDTKKQDRKMFPIKHGCMLEGLLLILLVGVRV